MRIGNLRTQSGSSAFWLECLKPPPEVGHSAAAAKLALHNPQSQPFRMFSRMAEGCASPRSHETWVSDSERLDAILVNIFL
jgi:hypothetical protein